MPWEKLKQASWYIVGMNHYRLNGNRYLYVAMMNAGQCIVSQGTDESAVFKDLEKQAGLAP
jgi:hypothetical protein